MPHFVGHVVDVKGIAHGAGRARYAFGFEGVVAHHAQAGNAAAAGAHHVADVVVVRADELVDVGLIFSQHGTAIKVVVGRGRLGAGTAQEKEAVVVAHQHQAHGQLALVHADHAVYGGYLAGQHAGGGVALGERILGGIGKGQAVGAQRQLFLSGSGGRHFGGHRAARGRGLLVGQRGLEAAAEIGAPRGRAVHVAAIKAQAMAGIGRGGWVDVKAVAVVGEHLGVEALGREVEAHSGGGIVEAHAGVGFNLRKFSRQLRLHHRGFAQGETGGTAIGQRQGQHQRGSGLAFERSRGQGGAQAGYVQGQGLGVAQGG